MLIIPKSMKRIEVSNKFNVQRIVMTGAVVLLLFNLACLIWYLFFGYQAFIHSDSAVKVLLAKEIFDSGQIFPDAWNYVNGDLFVVFGHLFIVPLLYWIQPGFTAHALAGVGTTFFILLSVWLLLREIGVSRLGSIILVSLVTSGFSGFMIENLYGQVSYGLVICIANFLLYFCIRYLKSANNRGRWPLLAVFLLTVVAIWSNPLRGGVVYIVPLIGALFFTLYSDESQVNRPKYILLLLILIISFFVGAYFHRTVLTSVNNIQGASAARWLSYEQMQQNFSHLMKGIFAILGGSVKAGNSITSIAGIYEAIRLCASLVLIFLMPISLSRLIQNGDFPKKIVAIFGFIALGITIFIQVFTTVPDMNDPVQSSRYLVPSLFLISLLVFIIPFSSAGYENNHILRFMVYGLVIVNIGSAYPNFFRSNLSGDILAQPGQVSDSRKEIIKFLISNDLHYGYAAYWSAGVNSVLSDGDVLIRQVSIEQGIPMPMRHLSSNSWFKAEAWSGKTFLMLTSEESTRVNWVKMRELGVEVDKVLNAFGFKIYVFKSNIASVLPGWDRSFSHGVLYKANSDSLRQVGQFNPDVAGGAVISEIGEVGALHYGPYVSVDPGKYTVVFDVEAHPRDNGKSVRLDVVAQGGAVVFSENSFREISAPIEMEVFVKKTSVLEFRVFSLGNSRVVFRSIRMQHISD